MGVVRALNTFLISSGGGDFMKELIWTFDIDCVTYDTVSLSCNLDPDVDNKLCVSVSD